MSKRPLLTVTTAAGLAVALTGAAFAQNNALVVDQTGAGNKLTVDQSQASGSWLGGLELTAPDAPVEALSVDGSTDIARQTGSGNEATIAIVGEGSRVGLSQDNATAGGDGNEAAIAAQGRSTATVGQFGSGNRATVNVTGDLANGTVLQNGDGNGGRVDVAGDGSSGTLIQNGNNNDRSISVEGGTVATVVQNGSGLTDPTSNAAIARSIAGQGGLPAGVQVISNATAVEITQTALPGLNGR